MARRIVTAGLVAVAGSIGFSQTSAAQATRVTASLVAETRSVVPGRPFHVALRQQIPPGWHTYWSNPGDSGLPTTLEWMLPAGFAASPITWPTPKRIAYGPVVDYGYENEVLLPMIIEVPSDLRGGGDVVLSAHASWLVCSDTCIPEDGEVSISVPVGAVAEPDPDWAPRFAATRAHTPVPNPFAATATAAGNEITVFLATGDASNVRDLMFFPTDRDVIDDDAPQATTAGPQGVSLKLVRNAAKPAPAVLNGVLVFRDSAAQADAEPAAIMVSAPIGRGLPGTTGGLGFLWAVLLAVAGGLLLNLMPCVLPVLSIKAFGLVEHARSAPREVRLQGVAYGAGVMISFALIAAALIGLRAAGAEIGWGFQLQSPLFVAVMIYVLFAVGLNLSGVFGFGDRLAAVAGEVSSRSSYSGSFLTGVLATLVATPCTAPFMAAAIGYAITQPWHVSLVIFEAVGLGLALPYLAIAFSPPMRRLLPKQGIWMLRLKQILAFPIYGTVVWLCFVLSQEAGDIATTAVLAGLVLIAFAAWLYESVRFGGEPWRRWGNGFAALAVAGAFALLYLTENLTGTDRLSPAAEALDQSGIAWQRFSPGRVGELQAQGKPIFVDFTAEWCITCKLNERVALADRAVLKAFADEGVALLRADWTRRDPAITRELEANGRAGVPLYLFYPKPGPSGDRALPVALPQILTAEAILQAMR